MLVLQTPPTQPQLPLPYRAPEQEHTPPGSSPLEGHGHCFYLFIIISVSRSAGSPGTGHLVDFFFFPFENAVFH